MGEETNSDNSEMNLNLKTVASCSEGDIQQFPTAEEYKQRLLEENRILRNRLIAASNIYGKEQRALKAIQSQLCKTRRQHRKLKWEYKKCVDSNRALCAALGISENCSSISEQVPSP